MSSTAMQRGGEPTYQQRSGRALEERTQAMIIAAAEQVMTARIAAPGPDGSIAHLTTADVCAAARGYVRRDGTEGPIPKATMWKHFKTIGALAAAVVETMTAGNRPVPDEIIDLAAAGARPHSRRETDDAARWEARFSSKHYSLAQLEAQFDAASARDDRPDMLYWAAERAARPLRSHRRGDRTHVRSARDWARRGLRLVAIDSRLDCMIGIRCAQTAAAAEAVLSREADYEPTGLSRIRSIKETEMSFAAALGWDLHRELARFHADHARGLVEADPEREMQAMLTVATTLPALCGPDSAPTREPRDGLRAEELADIIAGLCRIRLAYADHPDHRELFADLFGDRVPELTRALLACFPATNDERRRHEGNVRALLRLDDLARRLDRIDPAAEPETFLAHLAAYEQASGDLLRTTEFGSVRDILVARYLTAKARALVLHEERRTGPTPPRAVGSLVRPDPAVLTQAAIQFYDHAAKVTSRRGSAGVLRERAARARAELERSKPPGDNGNPDETEVADGAFETILAAINDLVLITISRRNRFSDTEIRRLLDMIDPMYYYITSGRN
ncbi:hypothetical protein [Nocardia thraciensis]